MRADFWGLIVRPAIPHDLPALVEISAKSFAFPWNDDDFAKVCRSTRHMTFVAQSGKHVAGFVAYRVFERRLELVNIAVHPHWRRTGIGRALLWKVKNRLHVSRPRLTLVTSELNLEAQLFFRSQGMTATKVIREYFEPASDEAGIRFDFLYRPAEVPETARP